MTKSHLFDSHALMAFFQKEAGAQLVAGILKKLIAQNIERLICVINLSLCRRSKAVLFFFQ
jgi:hypothetical protein